MRTYTTQQIIQLVKEYQQYNEDQEGLGDFFNHWLEAKELSEQPAKDQTVWVTDFDDATSVWMERKFAASAENNGCYCYPHGEDSTNYTQLVFWAFYSKTEPINE